ncbi:MAG: hybrid sensor histidine kinase/response regulator [Acidobacteria bacterium]|nr:hybrid sensor histidine kinase/response regulator [Acidobacteriota bacterium]
MSVIVDYPAAGLPPVALNGFEIEAVQQAKILVVDDSRLVRSVFSGALAGPYECMTAGSYDEAIECLRMYEFDLVLADVIMPGLSGIELLRKIVANYSDTAVIMVSSIDRPQRALDALRLGAVDYLIKPCELSVLQLSVERALERRKLLLDARRHKEELESRNAELIAGKAELQRLQSQVVQNEKMVALGRVAAGIAHELNNPVAFVHGNLDLLKNAFRSISELVAFYETLELNDASRAKAEEIKSRSPYPNIFNDLDEIIGDCADGTERIRDIVKNLRTFSRLDEAEFKKFDINAGIASTLRLLAPYFNNGRIELVREFEDIPEVDAFGGQLNQVWMNLLVNAAHAIGDDKGVIRVTSQRDGEHVIVTVADTGCGIPRQDLDRIFDPFYTTKTVGEGTGLGLSICFGIVERHGGTITVDSNLGEGTSVALRLPIENAAGDQQPETGIDLFFQPKPTKKEKLP